MPRGQAFFDYLGKTTLLSTLASLYTPHVRQITLCKQCRLSSLDGNWRTYRRSSDDTPLCSRAKGSPFTSVSNVNSTCAFVRCSVCFVVSLPVCEDSHDLFLHLSICVSSGCFRFLDPSAFDSRLSPHLSSGPGEAPKAPRDEGGSSSVRSMPREDFKQRVLKMDEEGGRGSVSCPPSSNS